MAAYPLAGEWRMARTPPGAFEAPPPDSAPLEWHAAAVPGTVAASLEAAGLWSFSAPGPLDDSDYWYRARISARGAHTLRLHGLATFADVWIDGAAALASGNMFLRHDLSLDLAGDADLAICFRALRLRLAKPLKRARWRSRLAQPAALRGARTSLIGYMPSWCPPVPVIGPWRGIELIPEGAPELMTRSVTARLEGACGIVEAALEPRGPLSGPLTLACAGKTAAFIREGSRLKARLEIPDAEPWWPHTHGTPVLHAVSASLGGATIDLGRVGFRRIEADTGADGKGFGLRVNGVDVFCRGSVWTNADIVSMPGARAAYEPLLRRMRDAGMNMVRIGGTFAYETGEFFDLCDELGLLVWQDMMFANLDYPFGDREFRDSAEAEARQFLRDTRASPSLAVVCGGSEIFQQAAMMGLPAEAMAGNWFETSLAEIAGAMRPDALFLPNTPFGGELPFMPGAGVSHYYGVSAYKRPLDDARRANVRFASECLGFANVPERAPAFEAGAPRLEQPCWGERVPYDAGAAWFFEDVRNHYIEALYGVSARQALDAGPERYLALSRAVNAELMEAVFSEFRRTGSPTRGGLTWFLKDVWPGAGWGLIDHAGAPKSVYHAVKRAFRNVQVLISDEGLNGLLIHVINETALPVEASLSLLCLARGAVPVMNAKVDLLLAPRGTRRIAATDLWGAFFDTAYAYRFGPPSHDATIASLRLAGDGPLLAEAFHFPLGRGAERHDLKLEARLREFAGDFFLDVSCARLAQSVSITDANWEAEDDWFHLAPGAPRGLRLLPRPQCAAPPRGIVSALNGLADAHYGAAP